MQGERIEIKTAKPLRSTSPCKTVVLT